MGSPTTRDSPSDRQAAQPMSANYRALLAGLQGSLFFVVLNVAMNIYTKWLFSKDGANFPLPWTMLTIQQMQTFMVLHPGLIVMRRRGMDKEGEALPGGNSGQHKNIGFKEYLKVCVITVLFCVNVGLNSLSLVHISITLNQTVRAFLPVGVLVLGCCFESTPYPWHSYATTGVLVFGIALSCWDSPSVEWYGLWLAFISTLMAAVGTSLNGQMLKETPFGKNRYGIANLIYVQSIPAMFIFAAIAYFTEGHEAAIKLWMPTAVAEASEHASNLAMDSRVRCLLNFCLVSFSSVLALLSNLGRCFLVAATSPLTETLAGNAKVAALCIIDHYLFHTALGWKNYAGIGLTFSGFSVHLLLQYASKGEGSQEPSRRSEMSENTGSGATKRQINRPRIISAADTGLAAEYLAVEIGRDHTAQFRRMGGENGLATIPELPRPRSVTWPQPAPTNTSGMFAQMDFSVVWQLPVWLEANKAGSPEDYSPLSVASLSPMARRSLASPSIPAGNMSPTSAARSRFYSDPTDTNNNRARLLEDVRLGSQHLQEIEEERLTEVPEEPPDLDLGFL